MNCRARMFRLRSARRGDGPGGFSLIEVIVAIGIVAVTLLASAGYSGALSSLEYRERTRSHAMGAAEALLEFVSRQDFDRVVEAIEDPNQPWHMVSEGVAETEKGRHVLLASADGLQVGFSSDPVWNEGPVDPCFEGVLVRDEIRSPVSRDEEAGWLAFRLMLHWPVGEVVAGESTGEEISVAGSVRR